MSGLINAMQQVMCDSCESCRWNQCAGKDKDECSWMGKIAYTAGRHEREIRNKAINEFVEKLKESLLHSYRHLITTDTDGFDWLTTDSVETHIDEVVKQMKEGAE